MSDESVTNRNGLQPVPPCGCGGEAEVRKHTFYRALPLYRVCCRNCGVSTPPMSIVDNAIEVWNRAMGNGDKPSPVERTAKVETVEKPNVFKCGECGQYFHQTAWGSPVEYCSRCGCRLIWGDDDERREADDK